MASQASSSWHTGLQRRIEIMKAVSRSVLVLLGAVMATAAARADTITTGWLNWTPPSSYPSTAVTTPVTGWWGNTYPYAPSLSGSTVT